MQEAIALILGDIRLRIEVETKAGLISPREQSRPRRRTQRRGAISLREMRAAAAESVDVPRGNVPAAREAEIAMLQVIGEDEKDVW
jgi:hypothetical protein